MKEVRDKMNNPSSVKGRFPYWYKVAGACPKEIDIELKIKIFQQSLTYFNQNI